MSSESSEPKCSKTLDPDEPPPSYNESIAQIARERASSVKLNSPPRPPRVNPAPSRPSEIPAQFVEANRQLETNRFQTGTNHREIIAQIEEDESLARQLQRSEIFESNQSWIRSDLVTCVPKATSISPKLTSKPKRSRRPPSPTHVFLTPFQDATPKSPCRYSRSSSEKLKPSESNIRRKSSSFNHPRPSLLNPQNSSSVERGFGGLPLNRDIAPPSDQNLPPSWLDGDRLNENSGNFSQKCLNAKNKITSFFSGRPKVKKDNSDFTDSGNHGNTNFGFKYSES